MKNLLKEKTAQLKPHLLRTTLKVRRKMSWRENMKTTARNNSQKICGGWQPPQQKSRAQRLMEKPKYRKRKRRNSSRTQWDWSWRTWGSVWTRRRRCRAGRARSIWWRSSSATTRWLMRSAEIFPPGCHHSNVPSFPVNFPFLKVPKPWLFSQSIILFSPKSPSILFFLFLSQSIILFAKSSPSQSWPLVGQVSKGWGGTSGAWGQEHHHHRSQLQHQHLELTTTSASRENYNIITGINYNISI